MSQEVATYFVRVTKLLPGGHLTSVIVRFTVQGTKILGIDEETVKLT